MTKPAMLAGLAAGLTAAVLAATYVTTLGGVGSDAPARCRETAIAGADIGGPFELVNAAGRTVTDADVLTRPSLVYFGYTYCPDVCPADTARNAEAVDLLQADGHDVQPVFISVDPERDTSEVVGKYAAYMHEDMIGLTGTPEQVRGAAQAYRAYYRKQRGGDPEFYLVDHSTFTYLMLPGTGFAEFFQRNDTARQVAVRTACLVNAAQATG